MQNKSNEVKILIEALDTLIAVVGLTAIKYPAQLKILQEAVDNAKEAIKKATESK